VRFNIPVPEPFPADSLANVTAARMSSSAIRSISCLLVFSAFALCSSSFVFAGTCGDYLQHKMPGEAKGSESFCGLFFIAEGKREMPLTPKRCSGPRCSESPLAPVSSPPPAPTAPSELRVSFILTSNETESSLQSAYFDAALSSIYFFCAAEDIFHPPRVG
jgi:hypothetical protein